MRSVFSQSSGLHQFETLRSLKHERLACLCAAFSEDTEKDKEGIVHLVFEHLQGDHVTKHLSLRRKYSEEMVASVIRQVSILSVSSPFMSVSGVYNTILKRYGNIF